MSLKPEPMSPIPQETVRLAKAVFPEGSPFIKMRDELGTLFQDEMFAALFPKDGRPALAPWRLALVTIMQFTPSQQQPPHSSLHRPRSCRFASGRDDGEESRGSVNQKVAPPPGVLSMPTCPCCLLISCW